MNKQGLGFLRVNIGNDLRMHIWDDALEYPNVSKMHNHSWDLQSKIVCGTIYNHRFAYNPAGQPYLRRRLRCGVGCEWVGNPELVHLSPLPIQKLLSGQMYFQHANEIHITQAVPGTITLMHRKYDGPNGEADIFWELGKEWGTAEPHEATAEEIETAIKKSLLLMFQ